MHEGAKFSINYMVQVTQHYKYCILIIVCYVLAAFCGHHEAVLQMHIDLTNTTG